MSKQRRGVLARARDAATGFAAGAVLLLAGCGGQAAQAVMADIPAGTTAATTAAAVAPVATTAVSIQTFKFSPAVITVHVGSTVTWTNNDIEQHTATAGGKTFDSGAVDNGKTFSFTFTKAGSFDYSCLIHPEMVGKVIVTAQ